jgi:hypothetical protein
MLARGEPSETARRPDRAPVSRRTRLGLVAVDSKPPGERFNEDIPLAFGYFVSCLREQAPECDVIVGLTAEELLTEGVDLIGISATTEEFERARSMAAFVKENAGTPVIIGGAHISVLPPNLTSDMDVAVLGEGEVTLVELLKSFSSRGNRFVREDLGKIRGIAFRENGALVTTPARPLIRNLDRLPLPDRRKIGIARPGDRAFLFTSRGCRYRCVFCASSRFWGSLRCFSPGYVVREIEHVHRDLGLDKIHFFDDLFITPLSRLREICRLLEESGLNRDMSFSGAVRADLVSDDVCEILNRMNFTSVMFGLESFSENVLDYLKCGTLRPEDNQRALDLLHKHSRSRDHIPSPRGQPCRRKNHQRRARTPSPLPRDTRVGPRPGPRPGVGGHELGRAPALPRHSRLGESAEEGTRFRRPELGEDPLLRRSLPRAGSRG